MPLFACSKCNTVENTAISHFWSRGDGPALCSACDPKIGKWHGRFPRESADEFQFHRDSGDPKVPFIGRKQKESE